MKRLFGTVIAAIVVLCACSSTQADRAVGQKGDRAPQSLQASHGKEKDGKKAAKGDAVVYRVAADEDFTWSGRMENIWYPDLNDCGEALKGAGAIGDRLLALKLQTAMKEEFKRQSNWPADSIQDAGLAAFAYFSISEDRPEPPRIPPVVIETVEEERVRVKIKEGGAGTLVTPGGWQSAYAEAGVDVEIVNRRTERVEYPEYRVKGELKGWHVNLAVEVYHLKEARNRKELGAAAMTGMAYMYCNETPSDDVMAATTKKMIEKMHSDSWRQSSKPRDDEQKLKVAYRAAADSEWVWDGGMESIFWPDYGRCGRELSDLGALSDRVVAMNLQRAARQQFKDQSNWPTQDPHEAGLIAMIYYTVEQDAPAPPIVIPVEVTVVEEQKVQLKVLQRAETTSVSHDGWQRLFSEAGVKVSVEKRKSTTEKREEVVYKCDESQPRGFHVSVAIEVYYMKGEGKKRRAGKVALMGMAYWFSPRYPSDGKFVEVTQELVMRMDAEGRR